MAKKSESADNSPRLVSSRISIPLMPDGEGIAWEQMRESTKEKFAVLVNREAERIATEGGFELSQEVSDETLTDSPLGQGITVENISTGIDILAQSGALVIKMLGPRFLKHPFFVDSATGKRIPFKIDDDILHSSFVITEEQHAELDPRALRIAKKYSQKMPDWLVRNLDLYMLLGMFVKYQAENVKTAMSAQMGRDMQKAREAQAKQSKSKTPPPPDGFNTTPEASEGAAA